MINRRRFDQTKSFKERFLEEAASLREEAELLPFGPLRETALKKARELETAAHVEGWINSPGLRPPTQDNIEIKSK